MVGAAHLIGVWVSAVMLLQQRLMELPILLQVVVLVPVVVGGTGRAAAGRRS